MKKTLLVLFLSSVALIISLIAGIGYIGSEFLRSRPDEVGHEVVYEVLPRKSFSAISRDLESKGLIKSAMLFNIYARAVGERSRVKVGEYLLKTNMTPSEIMRIITSGKSIARSITVTEGLSIYEIGDLFEKQGLGSAESFVKLVRDRQFVKALLGEERDSLEGYLFPETYMVTKYTDSKAIIQNMVKRFMIVFGGVSAQAQLPGWSRHEVVTLASIIEKETGAPQERSLISSVFHNRLQKKMRLQTDPTVIYGKAEATGKVEINITRSDLVTPTRYNTYVISGLPPGPISNPGRESLLAALRPEASQYLFFVSQNDGTHVFTKDYKDHQAAVAKFQLDRKAREGKSWRDLKKSEERK
jgi:UPF0755 protein